MRAVLLAMAPDKDGRSLTTAKMAIFQNDAWQPPKEMSMDAYLTLTPRIQYSVEGIRRESAKSGQSMI
jgi:hypothetical protein